MRDRDAIVGLPNNSSMREPSVRAESRTTHFAGLKIFEMRWWEPGMVRHAPRRRRVGDGCFSSVDEASLQTETLTEWLHYCGLTARRMSLISQRVATTNPRRKIYIVGNTYAVLIRDGQNLTPK